MLLMNKDVCAVIVTYGDRADYFTKVIKRLNSFVYIRHIVLVNNDVSGASISKLDKLKINCDKLIVFEEGFNSGSAKGFKDGISEALRLKTDFIWLLDDDNLPEIDALDNLLNYWMHFSDSSNKNFALLSYRPDRKLFKKAIQIGNPNLMLGVKNSFLGFHLFDKIKNRICKEKPISNSNNGFGQVSVAPYGGLFFHSSLVDIIGLPDTNYFLYGDDYDYSYRITKSGGSIFLITNSQIVDLEQSFHLKKENEKLLSNRLIKTNSKDRIFYSIRNGITFEQNFVTNKLIYVINGLFHIILTLFVLVLNPKHLWKYKYYIKGIKDSI